MVSVAGHYLPRAAFGKIVLNESRLAFGVPIGLVMGLGLPPVLLVIFGSLPAFSKPNASLGGLTYFNAYLPILLACAIVFGFLAVRFFRWE